MPVFVAGNNHIGACLDSTDNRRSIDHISGDRYIPRVGSGYLQLDYDQYGYEYSTALSRLQDLARDLAIISARLGKLLGKLTRRRCARDWVATRRKTRNKSAIASPAGAWQSICIVSIRKIDCVAALAMTPLD